MIASAWQSVQQGESLNNPNVIQKTRTGICFLWYSKQEAAKGIKAKSFKKMVKKSLGFGHKVVLFSFLFITIKRLANASEYKEAEVQSLSQF